jgi:hypothetical protein
MIALTTRLSNPWTFPRIATTIGDSGTSGTGGTGGTGGGSTVAYTLIRFEGGSTTSGTPGSSNCIYEIYLFTNGQVELRLGNWGNSAGVSGHYTSGGTGTSFSPTGNTSYVWSASGTTTTFYTSYTYVNGALSAGNAAPSLGASSVASWPPSGYTNLQNGNVDDSFVTVPITSTNFFGTSRTNAYVGSNSYITFGAGATDYSGLSATLPAVDKFMFNSGDRSYQRVGYITGAK